MRWTAKIVLNYPNKNRKHTSMWQSSIECAMFSGAWTRRKTIVIFGTRISQAGFYPLPIAWQNIWIFKFTCWFFIFSFNLNRALCTWWFSEKIIHVQARTKLPKPMLYHGARVTFWEVFPEREVWHDAAQWLPLHLKNDVYIELQSIKKNIHCMRHRIGLGWHVDVVTITLSTTAIFCWWGIIMFCFKDAMYSSAEPKMYF